MTIRSKETTTIPLDDRDQKILDENMALLDAIDGPRCGDYVIFADGVTRRISHIWEAYEDEPGFVQTSDGGSFYLGPGYVSMSGSLYSGVRPDTLTLTEEKRDGAIWFFHHNWAQAHNGVGAQVPFRVYTCSREATT